MAAILLAENKLSCVFLLPRILSGFNYLSFFLVNSLGPIADISAIISTILLQTSELVQKVSKFDKI